MDEKVTTKIHWDIGTAYDLFISLRIIHEPERYSVRASWAAGVRSRVPAEYRPILEEASRVISVPLQYVHALNPPKNSAELLAKLKSLPPKKVIEKLTLTPGVPLEVQEILLETNTNKKWTREEIQLLTPRHSMEDKKLLKNFIKSLYTVWSQREEFGGRLVEGLQYYVDTFFAEEELRIRPVLEKELSYAKMRAGSLPLPAMLDEITSGVRYKDFGHLSDIVLAPTFWGSPFMFHDHLDDFKLIVLFGARPGTMSIVPGDVIPDALLRGMKALADPTRLRVLRYLAQEPQTASELSRVLRLRPPTVNHHLNQLRLAGMVHVLLDPDGEKKFAVRYEGFDDTQALLNLFVRGD